jgi:hypothetical protein
MPASSVAPRTVYGDEGETDVDITIIAAFVAFFALVLGWMVAPAGKRDAVIATEPGVLVTGEAHI